jgi:ATP-dependent Clp protease ATP-binding subunit ClpA
MFERFTARARAALAQAQSEAVALEDSGIDTEHLLLGLMQGDGIAARALAAMGVGEDAIRAKVAELRPARPPAAPRGRLPFSPASKKILELSLREALALGHNYIGTEHILLGLMREEKGVAARTLVALGADGDRVRQHVLELLHGTPDARPTYSPAMEAIIDRLVNAAGGVAITSGDVLAALVEDADSHASKALDTLGIDAVRIRSALEATAAEPSSDHPQTIEITSGDASTVIDDPQIATALARLTPEQLRAVLKRLSDQ